jgi:Tol biopolymer transport system component
MNKFMSALVVALVITLVGVYALTQIAATDTSSAITLLPTPTLLAQNGLIKFISEEKDAYIYTINPDGSDLRQVSDLPVEKQWVASYRGGLNLSPDGTRLVFPVDEDNNVNLYIMDIDGTNIQRLTAALGNEIYTAWSPDSQTIAFEACVDPMGCNTYDIYVIAADGTNLNRLTDHYADDISPVWSPDGRWIAFASDRPADPNDNWGLEEVSIYLMDPQGRNVHRIGEPPVGWPLVWSPDGQHAFVQGNVIDVDTKEMRTIVASPPFQGNPHWSPDGTQIAFMSRDQSLYVMDTDGTSLRRVVDKVGEYAWSPDGTSFVFTCGDPYPYNLCTIRADGTNQRTIELDLGLIEKPEWQPVWSD